MLSISRSFYHSLTIIISLDFKVALKFHYYQYCCKKHSCTNFEFLITPWGQIPRKEHTVTKQSRKLLQYWIYMVQIQSRPTTPIYNPRALYTNVHFTKPSITLCNFLKSLLSGTLKKMASCFNLHLFDYESGWSVFHMVGHQSSLVEHLFLLIFSYWGM